MQNNFEDITKAVSLLKTIANEKRLLILCRLNDGKELSVSDLAEFVGLSQSALSQHLAIMRGYGFVKTRREQHTIYYSLANDAVKDIIQTLHKNYCSCSK